MMGPVISPVPSPADPSRFGRRMFLTGVGVVALSTTAACNPFASPTRTTTTVTAAVPVEVDPLPNLIATSRFHLIRIDAAIKADKTVAAQLKDIRIDRREHVLALEAEYRRSTGLKPEGTPAGAVNAIKVPEDPVDSLARIRADAADAQLLFNDALIAATRFRAALYGSVSACLASHRAVLA